MAQLVARLYGIQKVTSSNLVSSTNFSLLILGTALSRAV